MQNAASLRSSRSFSPNASSVSSTSFMSRVFVPETTSEVRIGHQTALEWPLTILQKKATHSGLCRGHGGHDSGAVVLQGVFSVLSSVQRSYSQHDLHHP